jgi:hypothetical protein
VREVRAHPPADDHAAEGVDEEGRVVEALDRPDVGEIGHPEAVGGGRAERAVHEVGGTLVGGTLGRRDRRPDAPGARDTSQTKGPHEPPGPVAADRDADPDKGSTGLADPIDAEVVGVDPGDLTRQVSVRDLPGGWRPCLAAW